MLKPVSRLAFNSKGIRTISLTHSEGKSQAPGESMLFSFGHDPPFRGASSAPSTFDCSLHLKAQSPKQLSAMKIFHCPNHHKYIHFLRNELAGRDPLKSSQVTKTDRYIFYIQSSHQRHKESGAFTAADLHIMY